MTGREPEPDCLVDLANAVREKNVVDADVARLLDRPALPGHFGEFVASRVFDIKLHASAAHPGSDGMLRSGPLKGKRVNIKYTTKRDGLLNMSKDGKTEPHCYLVMTGPKEDAGPSQGKVRPWVIESVFVFDGRKLVGELKTLNPEKRIGVATYVPVDLWARAMIYPQARSRLLAVTDAQREQLRRFAVTSVG